MTIKYTYKGVEHTVAGSTTTLTTAGKYCEDDIAIEASGGITPTGNINITDTSVTDVTNYATAQVVDSDLVAGNIKKDVDILGITGTYEGFVPSGTITITSDGTYDVTSYATAEVQTSTPPQMDDVDNGGVVFINYNGDVLYQYNTTNIQAASELPPLPDNQGFKDETWNWTLAEIKSHLTTYPNSTLTVGVNLMTSDEKTHVFYEVREDTKTIYTCFGLRGTATIEWGDGSADSTITGYSVGGYYYAPHTYSTAGTYEIKISVNGTMALSGNNMAGIIITYADNSTIAPGNQNQGLNYYYSSGVKKLWVGKNIANISSASAFALSFVNIQEISLPNNLVCESISTLYYNCVCKGLVIPKPTNKIEGMTLTFNNAIEYFSLPPTITSTNTGSVMTHLSKLKYFTLTGSMTALPTTFLGTICGMRNLTLPNTITAIPNNACTNVYSLQSIKIPSSVTTIGTGIFTNGYSCKKLDLSNLTGVTAIKASSFTSLAVCEEVKLPPNLQTIGNSFLTTTRVLTKIKFPTSLTSIGNYAFQSSQAMQLVDFRGFTSIPSLGGTSTFAASNAKMQIVVPDSLYSTWIKTTNWTALASKIVKESDYND